ncbi:MAG: hydrogenase 3 maturation endopeptidase HyCI [Elusimicrobia bacterium]|nr:hydrogenase 3 maturation endopeptidase HyCI [Candidatus Obscuribacterium magneticum]
MKNHLKDILKGKVVIVGVGNPLRGDDAFGPALVERLQGKVRAACIDAGTALESYAGKISKEQPDTVLIADAVHLGRPPGRFEILGKTGIVKSGFTTHDISPRMFIEYLENQTKAEIYLLGVQPFNIDMGAEMSAPVKKTLENIEQTIMEAIGARDAFDRTPH